MATVNWKDSLCVVLDAPDKLGDLKDKFGDIIGDTYDDVVRYVTEQVVEQLYDLPHVENSEQYVGECVADFGFRVYDNALALSLYGIRQDGTPVPVSRFDLDPEFGPMRLALFSVKFNADTCPHMVYPEPVTEAELEASMMAWIGDEARRLADGREDIALEDDAADVGMVDGMEDDAVDAGMAEYFAEMLERVDASILDVMPRCA